MAYLSGNEWYMFSDGQLHVYLPITNTAMCGSDALLAGSVVVPKQCFRCTVMVQALITKREKKYEFAGRK